MIQWLRFAYEPDTMTPMKNGQSGREEMHLYFPFPRLNVPLSVNISLDLENCTPCSDICTESASCSASGSS